MKSAILTGLLAVVFLGNAAAGPAVLINTLSDRPIFSVVSSGITQTATAAPGSRLTLEPGLFSGLGEKNLTLEAGRTYYLARFGALPRVYELAPDQVLIVNQAGRAVLLNLPQTPGATATLAVGNLALGTLGSPGRLEVEWDPGTGDLRKDALETGGAYRLTGEGLTAWD